MEDGDPGGRHPAEGADSRHHRECSPRPPWDPGKAFPEEMGYSSSVGHGSSCGSASTASEGSGRVAEGSSTVSGGPLRWAQDLRSLLVDLEGLRLFEQFLEQEGAEKHGLYFWFACNGLRSCPEPSVQLQYMKSIYKHYIRNSMVEVSPPLKDKITEHVKRAVVDVSLFNQAQREFEQFLQRSAYPKFLQSDLYVEHVEKCHALATAASEAASAAAVSEGTPSRGDDGQNSGGSSEELSAAAEGPGAAAADSGSGEEDSSPPPMLPPLGLEILPTVKEDEELSTGASPAPLTRRNVRKLYRYGEQLPRLVTRLASEATSAVRPKSGGAAGGASSSLGVPHPYHVNNSSFVPPSAQDSELHSLSSGAYTDDTGTDVDSVPPAAAPCSASAVKESLIQRATHRMSIRKNANINRDSLGEHVLIPRTQMEHPYSLAEKNPEKFATSIIEKLHAVKKQLDCGERLERFHRAQAEDFPAAPPRGPPLSGAGVVAPSASSGGGAPVPGSGVPLGPAPANPGFCERLLGIPAEEVSSQSILDEHVSRVFDSPLSHTPPRAPSPRHRFGPAVPSPYAVLGHQHWHKKERDTCSSDSGAVRDFSPDDDAVHGSRRRAQGGCVASGGSAASRRTFRSGPQPSDSGVDSGASAVCEQLPVNQGATERVNNWILNHKVPGYPLGPPDPERDSSRSHKKSTTSGTSSRSKQNSVNTARSRSCGVAPGCGSVPGSGWGSQESGGLPLTQQPPDTMTQLVEARRRLEVNYSGSQQMAKAKKWPKTMVRAPPPGVQQGLVGGAGPQAAPGGGLCPAPIQVQAPPSPSTEMTVIGYCYSGETVPYRTKLAGRDITLRQFKSLISKKGNYRYFFRRSCQEFGTDVVSEEISDDNEVLPLWEGKIFAMVEPID